MPTPYERIVAETPPHEMRRLLRYVNGIRAFQGLAPIEQLRVPMYVLMADHVVQCPFWLSCTDAVRPTHKDIEALYAYLIDFGLVAVTPDWVTRWTRRHTQLWHEVLINDIITGTSHSS